MPIHRFPGAAVLAPRGSALVSILAVFSMGVARPAAAAPQGATVFEPACASRPPAWPGPTSRGQDPDERKRDESLDWKVEEGESIEWKVEEGASFHRRDDGWNVLQVDGTVFWPHSGELTLASEDLRIAGRGFDFVWARKYRSRLGPTTELGIGWDWSYDLRVVAQGADRVVWDGNTRRDLYQLGASGTWSNPAFFRELVLDLVSDEHALVFPDGGAWVFRSLAEPVAPGRVARIVDRNGNTMSFEYDPAGRLVLVRDTLHTAANPREIHIGYDASGWLESVSDWTGRVVRYGRYAAGDPGGAPGDLRSATTPAVVSTPDYPLPAGPGHAYPAGKTTTYTYATGTGDPELDHNLLTVTDPKGQTWLANTYAATTDPADLEYDRLVRQARGTPNQVSDYTYSVPMAPAPGGAVIAVVARDAVGNVSEELYDGAANRVVLREYTGRWFPGVPVTPPLVPPIPPLRPGDPAFFETRRQCSPSGLPWVTVTPNGTELTFVYEADLNPAAPPRSRGNLREVKRSPGTHLPVGDQATIVELFEYDAGSNAVTRHVDGRGHETLHVYDAAGNRVRSVHRVPSAVEDFTYNAFGQLTSHRHPQDGAGLRRLDAFTYYGPADGHQDGYLKQSIVDAPGLALTTTWAYDRVGHMVRCTDARGADCDWLVNQLGQVAQALARPLAPGGVRYLRECFYDANDNLVRLEVQNVDAAGAVLPNAWLTTTHDYDAMDLRVRTTREVDLGHEVVMEYAYDDNKNLALVRNGEATSGRQPHNETLLLHDERDLLFRVVRAPGAPDQSTAQCDYDGNGSLVRSLQGLEGTPRERLCVYDAYDRLVSETDPLGNVTEYHYDANSNLVAVRVDGELLDLPGALANVRLDERTFTYDPLDRMTLERTELFDPATGAPIGDGARERTLVWADNGTLVSRADDHGHVSGCAYDGAQRPVLAWDAAGNTRTYGYDANSNLVQTIEAERSDLGGPDQVFVTLCAYDGLDRRVSETDSAGNVRTWGYDSRDNETRHVDGRGNEEQRAYDGLGRLIGVTRLMAAGAPLVIAEEWDDSSRHVAHTDANGNRTLYAYDPLDRLVGIAHEDGSQETRTYDVHDNEAVRVDANGSVVSSTWDQCNRLEQRTIVRASVASGDPIDVLGKTFESYGYDGLARVVRAYDDTSQVVRAHDSLGHVVLESLAVMDAFGASAGTFACAYDAEGNALSRTYPGGRKVHALYDELERTREIRERTLPGQDDLIVAYDYVGARVERRTYGNGVVSDYEYDGITGVPNPPTDRGVRCMVRSKAMLGASVVDEHRYAFDAEENKTLHRDQRTRAGLLQFAYHYDSADRMVRSTRAGVPQAGRPDTRMLFYALDAAGNRTQVTSTPGVASPALGTYSLDGTLPEPADRQMNQYTSTPYDQRLYDPKGNLTRSGGVLPGTPAEMRYDYADRMVRREDAGPGVISEYHYDALGRRVSAVIVDPLAGTSVTRYLYDGEAQIEEQDQLGATRQSLTLGYVFWEDPVASTRASGTLYFHADDAGSVLAVTDASGAVVERYEYDDGGEPLFTDPNGQPLAQSAVSNDYLWGGLRWCPEAQLYWDGAGYFEPRVGRFTARLSRVDHVSMGHPGSHARPFHRAQYRFDPRPSGYQRVEVQFHWDREGKLDDKSSCWVRAAEPLDPGPSGAKGKGEHKQGCTCETCKRVSYIMVHHQIPHRQLSPGVVGCPKCGNCHDPTMTWLCKGASEAKEKKKKEPPKCEHGRVFEECVVCLRDMAMR
jgi:YD repeat-containing protein